MKCVIAVHSFVHGHVHPNNMHQIEDQKIKSQRLQVPTSVLIQSKTNRGIHRYNFMHDYSTFQQPRITQITLNTLLSLQHKEINVMGVVV